MPFWFHSERRRLMARLRPSVHCPRQQPPDRGQPEVRSDRDLAITEVLRTKREQQSIAGREPVQGIANGPQAAVFIRKVSGFDNVVVGGRPGNPSGAPALAIAGRVGSDGEQPATNVRRITTGAKVPYELEEGFLRHVFGILVMTQQHDREAIHRRTVLLEELLGQSRGVSPGFHPASPNV